MSNYNFEPYNDEIDENPDRDYIAGPYSTFDPELSRIAAAANRQRPRRHSKLHPYELLGIGPRKEKLVKRWVLMAATQRLSERKLFEFNSLLSNEYIDILSQPDMRKQIIRFDTMSNSLKLNFAQTLVNELIKTFKPDGVDIPPIPVKSSTKTEIMCLEHDLDDLSSGVIHINFSDRDNKDAGKFCRNLFHEFVHWVDVRAPNASPLGAQIANLAQRFTSTYRENTKNYFLNPTEINAYISHEYIPQMVEAIKKLPPNAPIPEPKNYPMTRKLSVKMRD